MQNRNKRYFFDETEHINITMPMYNLIEYNDNYSDTSGSLWQFKRDEKLIWQTIILNLLSTNQILFVILLQMGQTEKKKV